MTNKTEKPRSTGPIEAAAAEICSRITMFHNQVSAETVAAIIAKHLPAPAALGTRRALKEHPNGL